MEHVQTVITRLQTAGRVLITGEAARGKTTFACALKGRLELPVYSTDTFLWKKKFSEQHDMAEAIEKMNSIYQEDIWIVEGTTRELVADGIDRADIIFYFEFGGIWSQWMAIIRRYFEREEDSFLSMMQLLRHVLYKRYRLGYMRGEETVQDLIVDMPDIVYIHSFAEWRHIIDAL